ncbi:MAG: hypothetical protein HY661_17620 [Betaproteobacteria bacterium]|nr:hypothetical protein [Betaproteobacteria bacterium]
MESLSLSFVGWFFTLFSAAVLVLGFSIIGWLYRSGKLGARYLQGGHLWNDALLLVIWNVGLAGGIGVLARQSFGRYLLGMFCWVLIALVVLSAANRLWALRQAHRDTPPGDWIRAISAALVLVLPVVALCGATIVTLRSEAAWRAFVGS